MADCICCRSVAVCFRPLAEAPRLGRSRGGKFGFDPFQHPRQRHRGPLAQIEVAIDASTIKDLSPAEAELDRWTSSYAHRISRRSQRPERTGGKAIRG